MLRSEVEWFRRFILICETRLSWINPEEMDYVPMQRQICSIMKAHNQPHFENLIHTQEELMKKAMASNVPANWIDELDLDNLAQYVTYGSLSWVQSPSANNSIFQGQQYIS